MNDDNNDKSNNIICDFLKTPLAGVLSVYLKIYAASGARENDTFLLPPLETPNINSSDEVKQRE